MRGWIVCAGIACVCGLPAAAAVPARGRTQFNQALTEAQHGHLDAAYLLAKQAATDQPDNREFVTVRDFLRQRAILAHLDRAHGLDLAHQADAAALEYRTALALDPDNPDARRGLADDYPQAIPPAAPSFSTRVKYAAPPIELAPSADHHEFAVRGATRTIVDDVAAAYGLKAYVANTAPDSSVRLDIADASFAEAMAAVHALTGLDWIPIDAHTIYLAPADQLHAVAPVALRTFYLPWANGSVELTEIANVVKDLLGVREATTDVGASAISVRATPAQLDAAEKLLLDLGHARGEVVLELQIVDINAVMARGLGLGEPDTFTMFALGPLLAELQQSGNLEQNILQLFEQGGLNAVLNSGQLPSNLSGLASQLSPLLQNPFVTFGGGATLLAVSVPNATATVSDSDSRATDVETALLRSISGQAAQLKVGERYPIINASFSPISLSPAISQVIGNGSFIQPFPSYTYEDLGLTAKVTPYVHTDGTVNLSMDLTVAALSGTSSNNIPILSNRHLVTSVSVGNNDPVVVGGLFTLQETRSLSGLPGLSSIPVLGRLFSTANDQTNRDRLVLVITPHVVQVPDDQTAATWLPATFAPVGNVPSSLPTERPTLPNPGGPGRFNLGGPGRAGAVGGGAGGTGGGI